MRKRNVSQRIICLRSKILFLLRFLPYCINILVILNSCCWQFNFFSNTLLRFELNCRGLSTILVSGNITTYPNLCAKVTASFSVLSDTINAVKSSLEEDNENKDDNGRKEITNFITQLQKSESDKLNLTAALHLERLRLRNLRVGDGDDDDVTMKLLTEGIRSLETKIASAVESINEVLEELRCIAAE